MDYDEYDSTTGKLYFKTTSFSPYSVTSSAFDGGDGSKDNPFIISNASQLANAIYSVTVYDLASETSQRRYYKLANDISANWYWTINNAYYAIRYFFNAELDGDGHTITLPNEISGIYYADDESYIHDLSFKLTLKDEGVQAFIENGYNITLENVDAKGVTYAGGNVGAYIIYAQGNVTLKDCTSYVDFNSVGIWSYYNAVFIGYPFDGTFTFENCVNEGSLVTGQASMFVANGSYKNNGEWAYKTLNIINCKNNGTIQAVYVGDDYTMNYFYGVGDMDKASLFKVILDGETYTHTTDTKWWNAVNDTLQGTGSFINGPKDKSLTLKLNEDGTFTITPLAEDNVAYYEVRIGAYVSLVAGGSDRVYATETIKATGADSYTTTLKNLSFIDADWIAANPKAVAGTLAGNKIYTLDGVSYYDALDSTETLNGNAKAPQMYAVSAFDKDGNLIDAAPLSK
jgi:hypothetical protein